tara:strand:- start:375 stop:827 length:453 start_codon:yes stop_codon:yes gene_type:complete
MAFWDRPECNPPHEYDSRECYIRYWEPKWFEWQKDMLGRGRQITTKLKAQSKYVEAFSDMETRKSQSRIERIKQETAARWKKVAQAQAGVAGKMSGEFTSDKPSVTPPKSRKIIIRNAPSVQIAGLESKAFSEGTYSENKFKGLNRTRPK